MPEPNALPRVVRIAAAAALVVWLAVALWIIVHIGTIEPTHPTAGFTDIVGLLQPGILFAALALLFVVVPRRLALGWRVLLVVSLFGILAWLLLRPGAYRAVPWVSHDLVSPAVWMTLGLILGLIVLSLVALEGVPVRMRG